MLKLYHGSTSVCSVKVRLVLAEKELEWDSHHIDLSKGEQFAPDYLRINPHANVPLIEHQGRLIFESSVISEYLDTLSAHNPLMPDDPFLQAQIRTWGIYTLDYHDAVHTLTFASYQRASLLKKSPEDLQKRWDSMPNRIRAAKMADLVANGSASDHVPVALKRLSDLCGMIDEALADRPWLMGDRYSLAETLVLAYLHRVDCIGLSSMWQGRFDRTTDWYRRATARPSMETATGPYFGAEQVEKMQVAGREAFLSTNAFSDFVG